MSNLQNKIKFYNKGEPYYELTNFYPALFSVNEIPQNLGLSSYLAGKWKTSEHLFQAAKFTDQKIIEEIRQASDTGFRQPRGVFWLANSKDGKYREYIRANWRDISICVERWKKNSHKMKC